MSNLKTVVLVTDQFQCERLIHKGKALADITNTELCVFNVQSQHYPQNPLALEHLFHVSKQHGAMMSVAYGNDPAKQIISFLKRNKVRNVLTGAPVGENSLLYEIWRKFTHIMFFTLDSEGNTAEVTNADKFR